MTSAAADTGQSESRPRRSSTLVATLRTPRDSVPGAGLARALVIAGAFTSTWTAVVLGGTSETGTKPVDLLFLLAAVVGSVAVATRWQPLPSWLWLPATVVLLVVAVHVVFPTEASYLASRSSLDAAGQVLPIGPDGLVTVLVAVRWLVALALVPWLVINLFGKYSIGLDVLVWTWAAGAAVSGYVAVADFAGITQVGAGLIGYAQQEGRQTGLASQPNHLGFACVLAAPVAIHLFRRHRLLGVATLAGLAGGIVLSGSRGAQLTGFLVAAVAFAVFSGARRHLPVVLYGAAFAAIAAALSFRTLLDQAGNVLRFGQNASATSSDEIRAQIAQQALDDIAHRPVFGIGLQVLLQAHNVYLQALAAGGILLLGALLVLMVGSARASLALARRGDPLAPYLFACILTWAVCGAISNQVTDRYLYLPVAVIAALAVNARAPREVAT